jgi:hypothetical protein
MADDTGTILDLYKTAVEMADRLSARRAGANTFFLTLNTALAAVVGIVSSARKPPPHGNVPSFDPFGLGVTAIAGIIFASVWWLLLRYYKATQYGEVERHQRARDEAPRSAIHGRVEGNVSRGIVE